MSLPSRDNAAFTMIELLMVIMLVSVLGAVALPQFLDFRKEGRIAAATQRITTMRSAITNMKAQLVLRCSAPGSAWPSMSAINLNDVVASGDCTTTQVQSTADRHLADITLTPLPAVMGEQSDQTSPVPYLCTYTLKAGSGNLAAYSPGNIHGTSMWCYDMLGNFWAESSTFPQLNQY